MHISRIQVEEGFLDGLDLHLTPGLNVVIGARGTGKTSLIELVRYCLDAPSSSPELGRRSREHALSILGGGQVTVTLSDGTSDILVSRTAGDENSKSTAPYTRPIVFSQTEIETVGLSAKGRLQLIDAFIPPQSRSIVSEPSVAEIRSLAAEIAVASEEASRITSEVQQVDIVLENLLRIAPAEARISTLSAEATTKKQRLDELSDLLSANAVRGDHVERFLAGLAAFIEEIDSVVPPRGSDPWPEAMGPDPISGERTALRAAVVAVKGQVAKLSDAYQAASVKLQRNKADRVPLEDQARELRREIEGIEKGAGAIAREAQTLRQRRAQLEETTRVLASREAHLEQLVARRNLTMERLEVEREGRFSRREAIIHRLNEALGPRIRLSIERAGQFEQFAATLTDALKGSGLRYGDLSPLLAQSISPRELVEAIDSNDAAGLVERTGLSIDRASRILATLAGADLGQLATVDIEDDVRLELLDGPQYKDISELSTGQRCTVVLPVVLSHRSRIVVVDQPEDHIDNAFISDTLIRSIVSKGSSGQMVFSTHNANIPVLGDAEHVVQMASDGRRGFAAISAPLHDEQVVDAISRVMEGGEDAFRQRAAFYKLDIVS
jgi:ABC-type lipoprotein export system ATPase subunit